MQVKLTKISYIETFITESLVYTTFRFKQGSIYTGFTVEV